MKTALYGRVLFGASGVLFGVLALLWHDPDTWQSVSRIWRLPLGLAAGEILMVALIAGGVAILIPRALRMGSILLLVVYAVFTLLCVPGIFKAPTVYVAYGNFFEQFSLLCGAVAVYAATQQNAAGAVSLGRAARFGLGLCAVSFALAQIVYFKFTASLVPTWIPPNQAFWTTLTTIAFGLAAIAILLNIRAKLAMRLMTLMLALFGLLVWVPELVAAPHSHGNWSEFALNYLITGAVWVIAELQ